MMASGLLAAALLAAPAHASDSQDTRTGHGPTSRPKRTRGELYAPAPKGFGAVGVTGKLLDGYAQALSFQELERGTRLGPLALAPPPPPRADRRAGIGVTAKAGRLPLVAGVLALLALVAFGLARPVVAEAKVPDGFVGITTEDVYTGDEAYANAMLAKQRAAGFTIARQVFRWAEIEPFDNYFDFSATDRFVGRAAAHGIRVLPVLLGEPAWASSRPPLNADRALYPPRDNGLYQRFAMQVSVRYGPHGSFWAQNPNLPKVPITSYQLWNEPNFPVYWKSAPDATAYTHLVAAGSAGIRSVQPGAYIISGGIPDSRLGQNPRYFVRQMLAAGVAQSVNAIGIHPYAGTVKLVVKNAQRMRKAIDRAGGQSLGMWATEFGWAAGGPRTRDRTVKTRLQGKMVTDAFTALAKQRRKLKLRGAVYFAWRDSAVYAGGKEFWGLYTGLVDRSGNPKPALARVTKVLPNLK